MFLYRKTRKRVVSRADGHVARTGDQSGAQIVKVVMAVAPTLRQNVSGHRTLTPRCRQLAFQNRVGPPSRQKQAL